jgi:hypothetical protein
MPRIGPPAEKIEALLLRGEDLGEGVTFWVERLRTAFAWKPFRVELDTPKSLQAIVGNVLEQAKRRTKADPRYPGVVLEHLVGATLDRVLGLGTVQHNSFLSKDAPGAPVGNFLVGDVAIHVTASPGEGVIKKCRENVTQGYRPMLVTLKHGVTVAEGLACNLGICDQIDIFEIEQFVTLNLYEWAEFGADGRETAVTDLVSRYNEIVEEFETDPSLKIELRS